MTPPARQRGPLPRTPPKPQAKQSAAVKSSPSGPRTARREAMPLDRRAKRSYPYNHRAPSPQRWVEKAGRSIANSETPHPHVRFDTNDYSLDPNLVGRRVEVRISQREITAVALDTGELAARHERCFAKNRTITALEHARTLRERRGERDDDVVVEQRPLAVYDGLIA